MDVSPVCSGSFDIIMGNDGDDNKDVTDNGDESDEVDEHNPEADIVMRHAVHNRSWLGL
jgi:hypothetical protein